MNDAGRDLVLEMIQKWDIGYQYELKEDTSNRSVVHGIFSKPTKRMPAPFAVVNMEFYLDPFRESVEKYRFENEPHFYTPQDELRMNTTMFDRILSQKLKFRSQNIIELHDDFTRARIPQKQLVIHEPATPEESERIGAAIRVEPSTSLG